MIPPMEYPIRSEHLNRELLIIKTQRISQETKVNNKRNQLQREIMILKRI